MINACSSALEKRGNYHDAEPFGDLRQVFRRRSGNFFRQIEKSRFLALAKIGSEEQLLQADDLASGGGGFLDAADRDIQVGFSLGHAAHLDQTNGCPVDALARHASSPNRVTLPPNDGIVSGESREDCTWAKANFLGRDVCRRIAIDG